MRVKNNKTGKGKLIRHLFQPFLLALILVCSGAISAQVVWLVPQNPSVNETVTVFFNAALGNGALKDYEGNVYLHTGVITSKSLDSHDWKYVVGDWGKDDPRVLMHREGKNLYSFKMQIRTYYGLLPEDVAQQLVFVFRNADGSLVGKTESNEDITVPVNGYKPPSLIASQRVLKERNLISLQQKNGRWLLTLDEGVIEIQPFTKDMVSVTYKNSQGEKADSSNAVILRPQSFPLKQSFSGNQWTLTSGNLTLLIKAKPISIKYLYKGREIVTEKGFFREPGNQGVRFRLDNQEAVYGAGERAVAFDRRGYRFQLYNRPSYGYETGAAMLNYSIPLTFSSKKYAILFDNPQKGYVDIGKTEPGIEEWGSIGGTSRYFLIGGSNWQEIEQSYTQLTGHQSLPPRWALGNLQDRMAYRNQQEVDSIVTLMKKKEFPLDAIILDFYWFGDSIKGHLGRLDWFKPSWPDPIGMIDKFRKEGVKTVLITEPYIIDTLANYRDADAHHIFVMDSTGKTYHDKQFYFGSASLIDIFKPAAQDWFWEKYQRQIRNGVAGWWGDLGEPESHPSDIYHVNGKADAVHNIYGHYWDKMLFDKYAQYYPHTRLFHLQRSGFAGSQRYSAYPWTGDVSRSWGGLQAQLPLLLTMSLSGLGYIHSDAGGFAQGVKDDELYTRWLQFAVFTPILRPHGSVIPSEPVFWSEQTQDIVRKYIKLRYSLLPYNYSLCWQNTTAGSPLMRPLFYGFPNDTNVTRISDEYLWGKNILVAPVLKKGLPSRKVYLPEGDWFEFNTGMKYQGRNWYDIPLTIENIPLFVRAGSFIPTTKPVSTTDDYKADNYEVIYYPGGKSSFTQYEDDGMDNLALNEKKFELIYYNGQVVGKNIHVTIHKEGAWKGMPAYRQMTLKVRSAGEPLRVLFNGKTISFQKNDKVTGMDSPFYTFKNDWLSIHYTWKGNPVNIQIQNK